MMTVAGIWAGVVMLGKALAWTGAALAVLFNVLGGTWEILVWVFEPWDVGSSPGANPGGDLLFYVATVILRIVLLLVTVCVAVVFVAVASLFELLAHFR
ncbi:MAG: hypothetical protein H6734_13915 [Alphaproteobacteria bacterium]|nr:hypothetical protein [Alphaproteobacteria bacterium]